MSRVTVQAPAHAAPFPLRPAPEHGGECPRCAAPLALTRLRFAGWRSLLDGICTRCGHRYLQDLPAGHGLVYPATLDLTTGETFDPAGASWFSSWLRRGWEEPDGGQVELEIAARRAHDSAVLLNCLDPIYGHALLKLLNVQRELAGERGCIVLAPAALAALVPEGVAEAWIVHEPVGRLRGWLLDLEERIAAELDRFGDCTLSPAYPHPHPTTYDLDRLVGGIEPEPAGTPSIVLSVRDDRLWGRNAAAQEQNVSALWTRIAAAFPEAACTAVGIGGTTPLPPWVTDLRAAAPDEELERRWLALMRGADLAIGVHGSNLLLPSGLAAATVELVGEERYGNVFQDTLLAGIDPVAALGRHRLLYGDTNLTDVAAERVAAVAVSVLQEADRFAQLMTGPAAGQGGGDVPPIAASPAPPPPAAPPLRPSPLRGLRRVAGKAAAKRHRPVRLPEPPAVLADRRGLRFELLTADEIEQFVATRGHFEAAEIELATGYLQAGMTVIDVGANIGAFTAAFARAVAPGGTVHAFEPLTAARERLLHTLELNGLSNVQVNDLAVSNAEGSASLYDYGAGFESWAGLAPRSIGFEERIVAPVAEVEVPTTTLDAYAGRARLDAIDLLKIDVEGAEERVLQGARGLLAAGAVAVILLEVSDNTLEAFGSRAADVIDLLFEHGLHTFVLRQGRLRGFRVAGEFRELANVFALSAAARERLL